MSKKDMAEQARSEIQKMSNIREISNSPNLIHYYASGLIEGYYYCIMEYLDPKRYITLKEHCDFLSDLETKHILPLDVRYRFIIEIVSALRTVEEYNIFHGDLHLENILFDKETSFSNNFCNSFNLLLITFFSSIELISSLSFFNFEIKFWLIL